MPAVPKPTRERQRHFIREWRKHLDLTQEVVAERACLSRENYSRIERGKVPYNQDTLEQIAFALGREPAELIARNPFDPDEQWGIVEQLRKAAPELRAQIKNVVDALLKTGA